MSSSVNPALKAALLGRWERAESPEAPLTSNQREAIFELAKYCDGRPMPQEVVNESSAMTRSTSSSQVQGKAASSTASRKSDGESKSKDQTGNSFNRVETGIQFLEWFHQVEAKLQRCDDQHIRLGVKRLERLHRESQVLVAQTETALGQLDKLGQQYKLASTGTNALNAACQHLMSEQTRMSEFSEKLALKLSHFIRVERIIQKLNSPSFSVMSDAFPKLLDEIDESYLFLEQHPEYKQSRAYAVKYSAALSRGLGMIRSHIKATLGNLTAQAGDQSDANSSNKGDTIFSSIYGKFRAAAPRVSELINLLECHSSSNCESPLSIAREYESALVDCRTVYLDYRRQLMFPSVTSAMNDLSIKHQRDHCGLVRSTCAFLLHVCEDEYLLYKQFFHSDCPQFRSFLDGFCVVLYDTLRPLIIHLQHLETLSELTSILRSEILGHHLGNHPEHLEPFEATTSQLLQDIQERLVYRAHIYIRSDILGYIPHPGDLSYPEKLEMMESIAESISNQEEQNLFQAGHRRKNSTSSVASISSIEVAQINGRNIANSSSNSPADLHGMWYPTVRRTLVCLSKLYRCLEREIFQGLSQQALSACMVSVDNAAQLIANNKSPLDGQLFHIKHLLILREQIAPFQVQLAVLEKSLDFTRLKSAALNLLSRKPNDAPLSPGASGLIEYLLEGAIPDVKEQCIDSRKEVDRKLKVVCEAFIDGSTKMIVGSIKEVLQQSKSHQRDYPQNPVSKQPWAKPERLQEVVATCQKNLRHFFPKIQRSMQLYLAHRETEFILFRPIRNNVMSAFISLLQLLRTEFSEDDQIIVACPSQEQVSVLMTSLLMASLPRSQRGSVSSPPPKPKQEEPAPNNDLVADPSSDVSTSPS